MGGVAAVSNAMYNQPIHHSTPAVAHPIEHAAPAAPAKGDSGQTAAAHAPPGGAVGGGPVEKTLASLQAGASHKGEKINIAA